MNLTPYVIAIEDGLVTAAAAGDEHTRRTAAALAGAVGPAVRVALMQALAEMALEVTHELGDRVVEMRLEGEDVRVAVGGPTDELADERTDEAFSDEGALARVTLRMPEGLKADAEAAAARKGVSLNTWLTRTVRDAVGTGEAPAERRRGQRVKGWVHG